MFVQGMNLTTKANININKADIRMQTNRDLIDDISKLYSISIVYMGIIAALVLLNFVYQWK